MYQGVARRYNNGNYGHERRDHTVSFKRLQLMMEQWERIDRNSLQSVRCIKEVEHGYIVEIFLTDLTAYLPKNKSFGSFIKRDSFKVKVIAKYKDKKSGLLRIRVSMTDVHPSNMQKKHAVEFKA